MFESVPLPVLAGNGFDADTSTEDANDPRTDPTEVPGGLSHEQIARALCISKGVIAKYVARIEREGLTPEQLLELSKEALRQRMTSALRATQYGGRVNPDYAHVHAELKRPGVTLTLLWQEYVAQHGTEATYRYSQFAERYRLYVASLCRSMRQVHRANRHCLKVLGTEFSKSSVVLRRSQRKFLIHGYTRIFAP